ncbi:MAG: AraC family transcriptional regulator [Candidatus Neoclostridium sp.]
MDREKTVYHFDRNYCPDFVAFGDVRLYQIGRRYCAEGEKIAPHLHVDLFELTVVTGGSATVTTNGAPCKVLPGDAYLSYPGDIHGILVNNGEKLEYDYFAFAADEPVLKNALENVTQVFRSSESRVIRDDKISALIGYALMEFIQSDSLSSVVLAALFKQIVIYVVRDFNEVTQKSPNVSGAQMLSARISGYIDSHILSLRDLGELAEKLNYNYSYLSDVFKKTTSKTPGEYLREKKMEAAKTLVLENVKKIGEIAEILNYSSAFAFSKAFKNHFGISPKIMQSQQKPRS